MRWSIRLAKVGETSVRLHLTFFLLLIWVAAAGYFQAGPSAAVNGVIFVCLVFLCVLLHEFGHVFAARLFGIRTPDVTLLPIGGAARLERMPDAPAQEFVVAIAGPLVNVAIAGLLYLTLEARFDPTSVEQMRAAQFSWEAQLLMVNIALVVFNLIPAFPLDGGRILRALLAIRFTRPRATLYAARIGQVLAVAIGAVGLFANPLLVLIALFIFFAADAENRYEQMRAEAFGFVAGDAMVRRYASLRPTNTAEDAGQLLVETTQPEFPVVGEDGEAVGVVTRKALIDAMRRSGAETTVADFMTPDPPVVGEQEVLESVMSKLATSPARIVAVVGERRRLIGYVSADNASELFTLAAARRAGSARNNA